MDEQAFRDNPVLQRAVQHMLQTVGEAAVKCSDATLDDIPDIPWHAVRGMRHRIVHGYFGLDPKSVWLSATIDAPKLAEAVRRRLAR